MGGKGVDPLKFAVYFMIAWQRTAAIGPSGPSLASPRNLEASDISLLKNVNSVSVLSALCSISN